MMPTRHTLSRAASRVGILLLNSHFQPVHYNAEAVNILGYPKKPRTSTNTLSLEPAFSPAQLTTGLNKPVVPVAIDFTSGRRRYVCRVFHLDGRTNGDSRAQPRMVLVLEREAKDPADLSRLSEQYQLTNRECETVKLLLKGMTSKEIAMEMCISPNTVKAFLKLAMAKVGASNRTALVARLFNRASLVGLTLLLSEIGPF
jgi:DNA-binding CsgD family transcriptional regulator